LEEFIAKVFAGGKVTVPRHVRDFFEVEDGDYVKLALVEVMRKADRRGARKSVGRRVA